MPTGRERANARCPRAAVGAGSKTRMDDPRNGRGARPAGAVHNISRSDPSTGPWNRQHIPMTDRDSEISDVVVRERSRLGNFIRKRVGNAAEAEDILQDVFYEFVEEYRLPESIEQASAWLFKVARNRIIDRFRKKKEVSLSETGDEEDLWLDLALPSPNAGPEAEYARAVLLDAMRVALEELPA